MTDDTASDKPVIVVAAGNWSYFFRGQVLQLLFLVAMVPTAAALVAGHGEKTSLWGLTARTWFWICVGEAVVHQVYVWLAWRGQLGWQVLTRLFGQREFAVYCEVFFPLLILRPILVGVVGWADRDSLALSTETSMRCVAWYCSSRRRRLVIRSRGILAWAALPAATTFASRIAACRLSIAGLFAGRPTRCTRSASSACGRSHSCCNRIWLWSRRSFSTDTSGRIIWPPSNRIWSCCMVVARRADLTGRLDERLYDTVLSVW